MIPQTTIGRRHALIEYKDFAFWIIDQGSINGTFVNGKKSTRSYLADGDRLTFGSVTALFRLPGKSGSAPAKKAAESSTGAPASEGGNRNTMILVASFVVTLAVAAVAYFALMK